MTELFSFLRDLINTMGFPIAMVMYFIWDKEKTMKPLIESINSFTIAVNLINEKMDLLVPKDRSE